MIRIISNYDTLSPEQFKMRFDTNFLAHLEHHYKENKFRKSKISTQLQEPISPFQPLSSNIVFNYFQAKLYRYFTI